MTTDSLLWVISKLTEILVKDQRLARVDVTLKTGSGETLSYSSERSSSVEPVNESEIKDEPVKAQTGECVRWVEAGPKLTRKDVGEIRRRIVEGDRNGVLAREYGVSQEHVSQIRHRRCWKSVE